MGFRYSKKIKIVPGLSLNLSRGGVGYSVGTKGARITKRADGRVTRTLGVPGTGLSHTATVGGSRRRSGPNAVAPAPAAPVPPRPKIFGPAWEKALFEQLTAPVAGGWAAIARTHGTQPRVSVLAATLDGLAHYQQVQAGTGDDERARELLGWAAANGAGDLGSHEFVAKYLSDRTWSVEIAGGVSADLTIEQDVALMAAAELHQAAGDIAAAIWVVEQADPTTPAALSLAELYMDDGRYSEVVTLTEDIVDEDDATALLLVFRARSFAQQGYRDAARETLKSAMRSRSRAVAVRHRALIERAEINLASNRKAAARKDLEMILAEDGSFPGLAEALASLPPT